MAMTTTAPYCEPDHHSCSQLTEVELQRACSPLYPPIAVDALANVLLFIFFFNVALMTHARGKLRSPTKALGRLMLVFIKDYFRELWHTVKTIPSMGHLPLAARLRCCGNIDKAISIVSTCVPLFAITRFLNIGNVNGARWVGYALTCPFMQMELIILIAPIVPCYTLNAILTFLTTFACLGAGWVSSVMSGTLYDGYIGDFMESLDIQVLGLNPKGMVVMPAMIGMACIGVLQVPWLAMLYSCRGRGERREDMPDDYRLMLLTVIVTWMMFPLWWLFSWEGASFFKDAKLNEMGFMILNMTAKGTFIYQSSRMSKKFEEKYPEKMADDFDACPSIVGPRHSMHRRKNSALILTLERFTSDGHKIAGEKSEEGIDDVLAEIEQSVNGHENFFQFEEHDRHDGEPKTEQLLQDILASVKNFKEQLAETKKAAETARSKRAAKPSSDTTCASSDEGDWDRQNTASTAASLQCHQKRGTAVGSAPNTVTAAYSSSSCPTPTLRKLDSLEWENYQETVTEPAATIPEETELHQDLDHGANDSSTKQRPWGGSSRQLVSCLPMACRPPLAV